MKNKNPTPQSFSPMPTDEQTFGSGSTATKLLTTPEAAEYLTIKSATLEQWRWNGRGPKFCKIGRSCRYRIADLNDFLTERIYKSTTEAQVAT